MRPDLWPLVTDLMHRALDVSEDERRAWVEAQAGDDVELAAEVLRLLDAHVRAGRFLEDPLIAQPAAAEAVRDALPAEQRNSVSAGTRLGQYRIIREIGRGGMGAVFLGSRADDVFEKQVAIKVAPGALVSDVLHERFNRERHLLAEMDHPGIARVLDGGATADGLQYLVMEYVDGTPVDVYCDEHRLGVEPRLRLFVDVCRAVQYAHDHLIVHRDIKASNVLVSEDGRPRLLDFGIAKLLARDERGDPSATIVHAWTPESASPEQVRGEATTLATDVYGLGALLYRLLTGRPVFGLTGLDAEGRARIICEGDPQPPSAIVAETRGDAAARAMRGDLDAIVMKALHKDPTRRYRSVEHLAEDVERHLAHRPVLASPDTWSYRARKLTGRHPLASAATTAAVIAVLASAAAALWQARRADAERVRAEARLTDVRRLANTLIFDLYDRVGNAPNATPMRRSLVQQGLAYLDRLAADAGSDPRLSVELAEAYGRLARAQGVPGQANLGDRDGALASLEKGRSLLTVHRAGADAPVDVELTDLHLLRALAQTLTDPERARQLAAEGVRRADALRRRFPDRSDVIEAQANVYFFAADRASSEDTLRLWGEANRLFQELTRLEPDNLTHLRGLALTEKYIGAKHHDVGRLDLARTHYERALSLDRRIQQVRPDDRLTTIDLAFDLGNVAAVAHQSDPPDLAQAASLFRESLALRERVAALDPQDVFARQAVGFCLVQLANVTRDQGETDDALAYGRRAVDAYESLPPSMLVARRGYAWMALGNAQVAAGRQTEGCTALRHARDLFGQAEATPAERSALRPNTQARIAEDLHGCQ
jgi:serine/threonine protein kinase/tetratricopeptide (TPR) repeat protein